MRNELCLKSSNQCLFFIERFAPLTNGKSLSQQFVGNGYLNHFFWFSSFLQSIIHFLAGWITTFGRPTAHIQQLPQLRAAQVANTSTALDLGPRCPDPGANAHVTGQVAGAIEATESIGNCDQFNSCFLGKGRDR